MKKQVLFMLLLLSVSFFVLSGCKKHEIVTTDTTFTLSVTDQPASGPATGYFISSGDPTTSGTFTMDIHPDGKDSLHCSQTLYVPAIGTITILSDCSMTTNTGAWHIIGGTGSYANLWGKGSLVMSFPKGSPIVEALYGQTWRQ